MATMNYGKQNKFRNGFRDLRDEQKSAGEQWLKKHDPKGVTEPKRAPKPKVMKGKPKKRLPTAERPVTRTADQVVIYTDGGCWPNPGVGGWGAVITMPDGKIVELTGGEEKSSNNRMELMGPIMALESLERHSAVTLYSDSQYVVKGITEWIEGWKRKGWISAQKQPVKNRELWERLDDSRKRHKVTFQWIRGHAGIEGNERADVLSQKGAIEACGHAIDFSRFRYK
jgi:ribonuclease HI